MGMDWGPFPRGTSPRHPPDGSPCTRELCLSSVYIIMASSGGHARGVVQMRAARGSRPESAAPQDAAGSPVRRSASSRRYVPETGRLSPPGSPIRGHDRPDCAVPARGGWPCCGHKDYLKIKSRHSAAESMAATSNNDLEIGSSGLVEVSTFSTSSTVLTQSQP